MRTQVLCKVNIYSARNNPEAMFSNPLANQRGVTLMIVLVMVVVVGLAAGMAGSTWRTVVQRANEEELLWRGDQYRRAIENYVRYQAGGITTGVPKSLTFDDKNKKSATFARYPRRLEDLLKDPRSLKPLRHLRQLYPDPMTGEDWELIKAPGGQIKGVKSTSKDEPFKQEGFDEEDEDFAGAASYSEWEFVVDVKTNKK